MEDGAANPIMRQGSGWGVTPAPHIIDTLFQFRIQIRECCALDINVFERKWTRFITWNEQRTSRYAVIAYQIISSNRPEVLIWRWDTWKLFVFRTRFPWRNLVS